MTYYQGRLTNHIHLRVSDLARSKSFYCALLQAIGLEDAYGESEGCFYADELYVDQADDYVSRVHLAFQAPSHEVVDRAYAAAVGAGGTDNGKPRQRNYHSHYYAAFVLDPDGNNIEIICEEPTRRTTDAIEIERLPEG
jgi:catechol 2,3-dioxygenase-like lactoylglutathione lyase family enzyme